MGGARGFYVCVERWYISSIFFWVAASATDHFLHTVDPYSGIVVWVVSSDLGCLVYTLHPILEAVLILLGRTVIDALTHRRSLLAAEENHLLLGDNPPHGDIAVGVFIFIIRNISLHIEVPYLECAYARGDGVARGSHCELVSLNGSLGVIPTPHGAL
jgi:hypothetical protein